LTKINAIEQQSVNIPKLKKKEKLFSFVEVGARKAAKGT